MQTHAGLSELEGLRQSGSLKLLFPRRDDSTLQAVLVNTAGGVTGGDRFSLRAEVGPGAAATLTTQAAERAYRARGAAPGRIDTRLTLAERAHLNWVPQETILFNGCAIRRNLRIDMAGDARLLMVESLVFGRAAMGETLTGAQFRDRIEIRRDGRIAHLDALHFDGNVADHLARPHVAAAAGAMASLVLIGPDAAAHLAPVRAALPATGGASLVGEDMLLMRLLAPDSFLLRRTLVPILNRLTRNALPRPWMI
ncbi:urease accessory protein UreD [Ruegeria aquimaris]|uniref:Urease accessory protein UreD n=1 Tax=Ruegeria aquimaris TaxID=2984333 RepID=A0ABT3ALG2_9RHOB|nr:urease accessory protein UreD [Ruegeria sp. XHP0148]MCV2889506.1 urease accessory protein UreD [Ruegeria sp. XHP0148]